MVLPKCSKLFSTGVEKRRIVEMLKSADYSPSEGSKTVGCEVTGGYICFEFDKYGDLCDITVSKER